MNTGNFPGKVNARRIRAVAVNTTAILQKEERLRTFPKTPSEEQLDEMIALNSGIKKLAQVNLNTSKRIVSDDEARNRRTKKRRDGRRTM